MCSALSLAQPEEEPLPEPLRPFSEGWETFSMGRAGFAGSCILDSLGWLS